MGGPFKLEPISLACALLALWTQEGLQAVSTAPFRSLTIKKAGEEEEEEN